MKGRIPVLWNGLKSEKHHSFKSTLPDNLPTNGYHVILLFYLHRNRDSFQSAVTGDLNWNQKHGLKSGLTIDCALGLVSEPQFLHL